MVGDVGVFVPAQLGEVNAREDLALQVGVSVVDAGVDDGDGDACTGTGLPHLLGVHGVQVPLHVACRLGVGGYRGDTHQQQAESRRRS